MPYCSWPFAHHSQLVISFGVEVDAAAQGSSRNEEMKHMDSSNQSIIHEIVLLMVVRRGFRALATLEDSEPSR